MIKSFPKLFGSKMKEIDGLRLFGHVDIRFAQISAEGNSTIGHGSKVSGTLNLGFGSTIAYSNSIFGGEINIGRYCQIGPQVGIYAINHPTQFLTTYLNSNLFSGRLKQNQLQDSVQIGNDVWIGHGAIVLPNVVVGDGAIIGAGSVVTKNLSSYSISVGNPAREIKKRFSDEIISSLLRLKWWNLDPKILAEFEDFFSLDLTANQNETIERLDKLIASYCQ